MSDGRPQGKPLKRGFSDGRWRGFQTRPAPPSYLKTGVTCWLRPDHSSASSEARSVCPALHRKAEKDTVGKKQVSVTGCKIRHDCSKRKCITPPVAVGTIRSTCLGRSGVHVVHTWLDIRSFCVEWLPGMPAGWGELTPCGWRSPENKRDWRTGPETGGLQKEQGGVVCFSLGVNEISFHQSRNVPTGVCAFARRNSSVTCCQPTLLEASNPIDRFLRGKGSSWGLGVMPINVFSAKNAFAGILGVVLAAGLGGFVSIRSRC